MQLAQFPGIDMIFDTQCQVCKTPMQIDLDPAGFEIIPKERCLRMATCDKCLVRFGRMDRTEAQRPAPTNQPKLPYKD